jgi:diguanylate cyclase (GGDEF)-like protein
MSAGDGCSGVLVATDDPDLRQRISRLLRRHRFTVIEALGAADALEVAQRHPVNLAVVDVDRSDIEVPEFLRRWQDTGPGPSVPVILVTARGPAKAVKAGIRLGAHDYLTPPLEEIDVVARVHSALEAKRRYDALLSRIGELEDLARTDSLTGVYNRRHMEIELTALASAARRRRTALGLLLIDVDRFKRINDRLSHEAGDTALRIVAHRIHSIVRAEDVVGRWGGDEFVVLLPSTDEPAAVALAERLHREVGWSMNGDAPTVPLTVSVGCAAAYSPSESALVTAADVALHRAKAGGRNRVCV